MQIGACPYFCPFYLTLICQFYLTKAYLASKLCVGGQALMHKTLQ